MMKNLYDNVQEEKIFDAVKILEIFVDVFQQEIGIFYQRRRGDWDLLLGGDLRLRGNVFWEKEIFSYLQIFVLEEIFQL